MDTPARSSRPPFHPLFHEIDVPGAGGDVEMVGSKTGYCSIVQNGSAVIADHSVANAPWFQIGKPVGIYLVKQQGGVFSFHHQLAQSAYVNKPGALADSFVLIAHRGVDQRALPYAHVHYFL